MKGKIILITGATSGIGKATAMALAKQGAHVIIHGRNEQKTRFVQQEIIVVCGHNHVDILVADLFLLSEVRKMAKAFRKRYQRLDILINNAGSLMNNHREVTAEGHERTIAVNLLAPFLLTNLLLDLLQITGNARIINVSSSAHQQSAKTDFVDFELEKAYTPLKAYGNAKLFLILASQHLVRKLREKNISSVTVNTLHPGAVASGFSVESQLGPLMDLLGKLLRPFFKTPEQGADTIIYLATDKKVEGVTGQYFINRKAVAVNKKYDSLVNEKKVWDWCVRQTEMEISV